MNSITVDLTESEYELVMVGLGALRSRLIEISDSDNTTMREQLRVETNIQAVNELEERLDTELKRKCDKNLYEL